MLPVLLGPGAVHTPESGHFFHQALGFQLALGQNQEFAVRGGWREELSGPDARLITGGLGVVANGFVVDVASGYAPSTNNVSFTIEIGHRSLAIDAILVDVIRKGLAAPLNEGLEIEAEGFARCYPTKDYNIGMTNFIQNGPRVPAEFLHE